MLIRSKKNPEIKGQLELDLLRPLEKDRNFKQGGRSFYFFDFDDNIAFLSTPVILFHKKTGQEKSVSSGEYARHSEQIGREGKYQDYFVDGNDEVGSFRFFRDTAFKFIDRVKRKKQSFVEDIQEALRNPQFVWKGPSWPYFYHAVFNRRPLSIITARGHHIKTIKEGIEGFVRDGHLPQRPNYLSVFPVSNIGIQRDLSGDTTLSVPELKRLAIRASVEKAIEKYGYSPYHRFGMSDDDSWNIQLISEEMQCLKKDYPEMSFFVIFTRDGQALKREIFSHGFEEQDYSVGEVGSQLCLF